MLDLTAIALVRARQARELAQALRQRELEHADAPAVEAPTPPLRRGDVLAMARERARESARYAAEVGRPVRAQRCSRCCEVGHNVRSCQEVD